jgi:hypothetical protein
VLASGTRQGQQGIAASLVAVLARRVKPMRSEVLPDNRMFIDVLLSADAP